MPGVRRGGRKAGTPNKRTVAQQAAAAAGISPLEFLLSVMRNEKADMEHRIDAAKGAAPYCHSRLLPAMPPAPPLEGQTEDQQKGCSFEEARRIAWALHAVSKAAGL